MFCNANILAYIWVVTRHQYEISALIPQISFWRETSRKINVSCFLKLGNQFPSQKHLTCTLYVYIVVTNTETKQYN